MSETQPIGMGQIDVSITPIIARDTGEAMVNMTWEWDETHDHDTAKSNLAAAMRVFMDSKGTMHELHRMWEYMSDDLPQEPVQHFLKTLTLPNATADDMGRTLTACSWQGEQDKVLYRYLVMVANNDIAKGQLLLERWRMYRNHVEKAQREQMMAMMNQAVERAVSGGASVAETPE